MAIESASLVTGPAVIYTVEGTFTPSESSHCRVFWGSHGCMHERGHAPEIPHECDCCECPPGGHPRSVSGALCVAKPPYYGDRTVFYGEEAEALGLPAAAP